jgi:glycogen synthase
MKNCERTSGHRAAAPEARERSAAKRYPRYAVFRILPDVEWKGEFVGRFGSAARLPFVFRALQRLAGSDLRPSLTVIGAVPEEHEQDQFVGIKRGAALVGALSVHRLMVILFAWNEPFGAVAPEVMACCDCVVIGSDGGGLRQAIGPVRLAFANGDAIALAAVIEQLSGEPTLPERCRATAPAQLDSHRSVVGEKRYPEVCDQAAA